MISQKSGFIVQRVLETLIELRKMGYSKPILLLGLLFSAAFLVSFEVAARELAEAKESGDALNPNGYGDGGYGHGGHEHGGYGHGGEHGGGGHHPPNAEEN
nr:hypothetical protein [Proteus mirabilis]